MMRASTRRAIASADVVIDVPLEKYGSLDWRRAPALIDEGYRAAEAMRDRLLPFAVSEEAFEAWRRTRQARRLKELPTPTFIEADGFVSSDTKRLDALLTRHVGVPLDMNALEADIAVVAGLDRYETVTWRMVNDSARGYGLRVNGRAKSYAPPFMMLGMTLENTTSSDFQHRRDRALPGVRHDRIRIGMAYRWHRRLESHARDGAISTDWPDAAVCGAVRCHRPPHLQRHQR